jgi:hydroxymethylpyrimidine/phosphomethylpyrimidine kinase
MKRILTIAGSDSGGGAGIQADLKTITVLGGFAMSALTALTAQNTKTVKSIHAVPPGFVSEQLEAVLSDIGADSVKTGMLFSAPVVAVVADCISDYALEKLVVDPVMVAKSGDKLLSDDAVATVVERLLPLALLVTPNLAEAQVLAGMTIRSERDVHQAAQKIHALGPRFVLIKGGHGKGAAADLLFNGDTFSTYTTERIDTPHTHGTGCVYSAAIAAYLAMDGNVPTAVEKAKAFIHGAIMSPLPLGEGHGPTNIFAPFVRELDRYPVLEALKAALARLQDSRPGRLIPEVQSNLGYALSRARGVEDVAAFPGRLVRIKDNVVSVTGPTFGASQHVSRIILTVMNHDARYRSAMNIRFSEGRVRHCERLGWDVASFDRADEPREKKEQEGRSLEWGTASVLSGRHQVPDVIFDRGEIGKEPMIRILGKDPREVVEKVLALKEA